MNTGQLFIEVGCEELPAGWQIGAAESLAAGLEKLLQGIPRGEARTWSTPRRLAVAIDDVALSSPGRRRLITGPPAAVAFPDGKPGKAAIGFARGRGVAVEDLEIVQGPRGPVVGLRLWEGGESTMDLLASRLESLILGIPFPRTMRWGSGPARWARPIHWVCALLDGSVIPATVAGIASSASSRGHRQRPEPFAVRAALDWLENLEQRFVMADPHERARRIVHHLHQQASALGVEPLLMDDLLLEVADLVEWPVVNAGILDPEFLELPPRLLVETMKVHQRIFPTRNDSGQLANVFLVVGNNPDADPRVVARGNARVLAARFKDARFCYDEDRRVPLEQHGRELLRMEWVRGLGTMAQRVDRLKHLVGWLSPLLGADEAAVVRAASLCKADLASQMVGEFPELQGHAGKLYALHQGESPVVADAIEQHYLPRFSGDAIPRSAEGRALALADRLDTLCGCFAVGLAPRGSADPQGLRRAANGLVAIVRAMPARLHLQNLLMAALELHQGAASQDLSALSEQLQDFVLSRFRAQLLSEGHSTQVVDAVLAAGGDEPRSLQQRVLALEKLSATPTFEPLRITFRRVMGLTREHSSSRYDVELFQHEAERNLHRALDELGGRVRSLLEERDFEGALTLMTELKGPVDALFDQVLVMVDDPRIRRNRLGLLRGVAQLFGTVADFTHLSAATGAAANMR